MKTLGFTLICFIVTAALLASLLLDEVHWRRQLQEQDSRQSLQIGQLQGDLAWYNAPDPVTFYQHVMLSESAFNVQHHLKRVYASSAADKSGITRQKVNIVYLPGFPKVTGKTK